MPDPDPVLPRAPEVVATSHSVVLDRRGAWCNRARMLVDTAVPDVHVVRLGV